MADGGGEMVVACTLGGHDLALQAERWRALRADAETGRTETTDGLHIRFSAADGVEAELRALVAVENECCAWASWKVVREQDSVVLDVRSTGDGVATLHGMFG